MNAAVARRIHAQLGENAIVSIAYLVHPTKDEHVQFTWSDDLNTVAITFYKKGLAVGHDGMLKIKAKALWEKLIRINFKRDESC